MIGGGFFHVAKSEETVDAIHGVTVFFPEVEAERPELCPGCGCIIGCDHMSEICNKCCSSMPHLIHDVVLVVEGGMDEAAIMVSRMGSGVWPDGKSVFKPMMKSGKDRFEQISANFLGG